jgi:hypothetical protein
MPHTDRTTVSRRSALRTGGLAAIMAGLLGTTITPAAAAEPIAIPNVLPTVVNTDDLTADWMRLLAQVNAEDNAWWAADTALEATLSPEQRELYHKAVDATPDRDTTYHEWISAEMARHAPGFSTMIRLLWVHAIAERTDCRSFCCTVAEGFEP